MLITMSSQSSGCRHIDQTSGRNVNKRCSPEKADGNFFLEEGRSADGGIHATMDQTDVRSVLLNTKKKTT
jgi:hypothetical protein